MAPTVPKPMRCLSSLRATPEWIPRRSWGTAQTPRRPSLQRLSGIPYSIQLIGGYVQGQSDILPGLADDITRLKEGALPPGIDGILKPVWAAITTTVNALPSEARRLLFAIGAFGTEEAGLLRCNGWVGRST